MDHIPNTEHPNPDSQWAPPPSSSLPFGQQPFGQQQVVRAVEEPTIPDYEIVGSPVKTKPAAGGAAAKRFVAAIGAVSLIGGATFAVKGFAGESSNTPTEAVQAMMAAAQKSDLVGMMEQLAPGERNLMIKQGVPILEELKRLDLLSSSTNLNSVDAAKITFAGQSFSETPLRDDIASVKVSGGTVTTTASGTKLYGSAFKKMIGSVETEDSPTRNETFKGVSVATIKRNGHWYVSLAYSLAEAARHSSGKQMPTAAQSIAPAGAATPELALRQMYEAAGSLDSRKAISLLDPEEFGVLQDYAPLFIGDVENTAAKARPKFTVSFPKMQIAASEDGGTAKVKVTYQSIDLSIPGENGNNAHVVVDGDCVSATFGDKSSKRCGAEVGKILNDFSGNPEDTGDSVTDPFSNMKIDLNQSKQQPITAVKRNGKWYIAPVDTLLDLTLAKLKSAKASDFDLSQNDSTSPFAMIFGLIGPRQKINESFNTISDTLPAADQYLPPETLPEIVTLPDLPVETTVSSTRAGTETEVNFDEN